MTHFDAAAAARAATDDPPEPSSDSGDDRDDDAIAPDHADAEGAESETDMGNSSRWREMLQSGDPDPPLEDVETPWNPDDGGPARVMRAVKKMGGFDGLPAWADLAIAIPETWVWIQERFDNLGDQDDGAGAGDDVQDDLGDDLGELGVDEA